MLNFEDCDHKVKFPRSRRLAFSLICLWGISTLSGCATFRGSEQRTPQELSHKCKKLIKHSNELLREISERENTVIAVLREAVNDGSLSEERFNELLIFMEREVLKTVLFMQSELAEAGCPCSPIYIPATK